MRPLSALVFGLFASLGVACAPASCPRSPELPCATKRVCTVDANGCERCACEAAPARRPEQDQPGQRLTP